MELIGFAAAGSLGLLGLGAIVLSVRMAAEENDTSGLARIEPGGDFAEEGRRSHIVG